MKFIRNLRSITPLSEKPNPVLIATSAIALALTIGKLENGIVNKLSPNLQHVAKSGLSGMGVMPAFRRTIRKEQLAVAIGKRMISEKSLSEPHVINLDGETRSVRYTIDARLQQIVEKSLKASKTAYGAFVALDPKTGKILAMASHGMRNENLALRATFPAASVFKIVTAASAIEAGRLSHNSMIPVLGSFHTLYKRNVFKGGGLEPETSPHYARLISFEDALAKSVNSVFGKVGIFGIGADGLRKTADRWYFGKNIPFDMPLDLSIATIPDDKFGLAESASGFTRHNTLSPIHGALIAAATVNDGVVMEPGIVASLTRADGKEVYEFEPKVLANFTDKKTADQLMAMMHRTITNGTSRGAFRGVDRRIAMSEVFIGGKTGTLNGANPPGRYDWFVGFAEQGANKIAVAALCIHGPYRGVKASRIARMAIEAYFQPTVASR